MLILFGYGNWLIKAQLVCNKTFGILSILCLWRTGPFWGMPFPEFLEKIVGYLCVWRFRKSHNCLQANISSSSWNEPSKVSSNDSGATWGFVSRCLDQTTPYIILIHHTICQPGHFVLTKRRWAHVIVELLHFYEHFFFFFFIGYTGFLVWRLCMVGYSFFSLDIRGS